MKTITFECETITPMFCYGADQKTPEIRAASIKGAMRFWWRALHPDLSIDDLRKKETDIFGGASDGDAKRSKVIVRVIEPLRYDRNFKYSPVPHKNNGNAFPQPALQEGKVFSIELKLVIPKIVYIDQKNKEYIFDLETLKSLFILFSIVGGIGKRSRRGFGSFKIIKIDGKEFEKEINRNYISSLIQNINSEFKINNDYQKNYPYLKSIQIGNNEASSSDDLLKKIGEASHVNDCLTTGFVISDYRFPSPYYVSVINEQKKYYPIISELNIDFKKQTNIEKIKTFLLNDFENQKKHLEENKVRNKGKIKKVENSIEIIQSKSFDKSDSFIKEVLNAR